MPATILVRDDQVIEASTVCGILRREVSGEDLSKTIIVNTLLDLLFNLSLRVNIPFIWLQTREINCWVGELRLKPYA